MTLLDLSEYQSRVDYQKVKDSGIDGVILRCGITYWGRQICKADALFEKHYAGFKAVGMPVGAYYYSAADSPAVAEKEARFALGLLAGKQLELPVYYDLECEPRMEKLTKAELTRIAEVFCGIFEQEGWFVGVYANTNYFQNRLDHAALAKKYTLWLADYRGENANRTLKRDIWQYTSTGAVSGIKGAVDKNECYRDFPVIIRAAHLNGFGKPVQRTYTVKPGDSFWAIAEQQLGNGSRMAEIAAANGMTVRDVIHPGDILKLP